MKCTKWQQSASKKVNYRERTKLWSLSPWPVCACPWWCIHRWSARHWTSRCGVEAQTHGAKQGCPSMRETQRKDNFWSRVSQKQSECLRWRKKKKEKWHKNWFSYLVRYFDHRGCPLVKFIDPVRQSTRKKKNQWQSPHMLEVTCAFRDLTLRESEFRAIIDTLSWAEQTHEEEKQEQLEESHVKRFRHNLLDKHQKKKKIPCS